MCVRFMDVGGEIAADKRDGRSEREERRPSGRSSLDVLRFQPRYV